MLELLLDPTAAKAATPRPAAVTRALLTVPRVLGLVRGDGHRSRYLAGPLMPATPVK